MDQRVFGPLPDEDGPDQIILPPTTPPIPSRPRPRPKPKPETRRRRILIAVRRLTRNHP